MNMTDSGIGLGSQLPPPPCNAGAPGYDNGQLPPSHLPPPPLHIPQNSNPIPSAVTSPGLGHDHGHILSPVNVDPGRKRNAPEPNRRSLYVGGLDPKVTEDILRQIFETTGHVASVKIIPDKNAKGSNYGFIDYDDPGAAEQALQTLNGRRIHMAEIRVNWAYQMNNTSKEDTTNHFHIFVGDLSNEVNDEILYQAFSAFGSISEARVMWDMRTGRSRGYGFIAFRNRSEAEKALSSMDGEWLGQRAIRCNWANQRGQITASPPALTSPPSHHIPPAPGHHQFPAQGIGSYDTVAGQTPGWAATCYVGNITQNTTYKDVVPLFQNFGTVVEARFQSDRGFAFIKMDTHENAAMAICQMNGYIVNGRPMKCSWGKDKAAIAHGFDSSQGFDTAHGFDHPQQGFGLQHAHAHAHAQGPGYPGTPNTFYSPYGAQVSPGQYGSPHGNFGGLSGQSPAAFGGQSIGFNAAPGGGGFGRGQPGQNLQWSGHGQPSPAQAFNNGLGGYQG